MYYCFICSTCLFLQTFTCDVGWWRGGVTNVFLCLVIMITFLFVMSLWSNILQWNHCAKHVVLFTSSVCLPSVGTSQNQVGEVQDGLGQWQKNHDCYFISVAKDFLNNIKCHLIKTHEWKQFIYILFIWAQKGEMGLGPAVELQINVLAIIILNL